MGNRGIELMDGPCSGDFYRSEHSYGFGATNFTGEISGGNRESQVVPKLGVKFLVPQWLECVSKVADFGARKYADDNWMKGLSIREVLASLERHKLKLEKGEELDDESGLPHECHIAWGTMVYNWYMHGPRAAEYKKFDDRIFVEKKGVAVLDQALCDNEPCD